MRNAPTNNDDVIDSRDIIARITELEAERSAVTCPHCHGSTATCRPCEDTGIDGVAWAIANPDDAAELAALVALAEEAAGYAADWQYGETLVRDSYFKTYAQEYANDIGAMDKDYSWPASCIDWDQAARELQYDYTAVDFDGVTYWVR